MASLNKVLIDNVVMGPIKKVTLKWEDALKMGREYKREFAKQFKKQKRKQTTEGETK